MDPAFGAQRQTKGPVPAVPLPSYEHESPTDAFKVYLGMYNTLVNEGILPDPSPQHDLDCNQDPRNSPSKFTCGLCSTHPAGSPLNKSFCCKTGYEREYAGHRSECEQRRARRMIVRFCEILNAIIKQERNELDSIVIHGTRKQDEDEMDESNVHDDDTIYVSQCKYPRSVLPLYGHGVHPDLELRAKYANRSFPSNVILTLVVAAFQKDLDISIQELEAIPEAWQHTRFIWVECQDPSKPDHHEEYQNDRQGQTESTLLVRLRRNHEDLVPLMDEWPDKGLVVRTTAEQYGKESGSIDVADYKDLAQTLWYTAPFGQSWRDYLRDREKACGKSYYAEAIIIGITALTTAQAVIEQLHQLGGISHFFNDGTPEQHISRRNQVMQVLGSMYGDQRKEQDAILLQYRTDSQRQIQMLLAMENKRRMNQDVASCLGALAEHIRAVMITGYAYPALPGSNLEDEEVSETVVSETEEYDED